MHWIALSALLVLVGATVSDAPSWASLAVIVIAIVAVLAALFEKHRDRHRDDGSFEQTTATLRSRGM